MESFPAFPASFENFNMVDVGRRRIGWSTFGYDETRCIETLDDLPRRQHARHSPSWKAGPNFGNSCPATLGRLGIEQLTSLACDEATRILFGNDAAGYRGRRCTGRGFRTVGDVPEASTSPSRCSEYEAYEACKSTASRWSGACSTDSTSQYLPPVAAETLDSGDGEWDCIINPCDTDSEDHPVDSGTPIRRNPTCLERSPVIDCLPTPASTYLPTPASTDCAEGGDNSVTFADATFDMPNGGGVSECIARFSSGGLDLAMNTDSPAPGSSPLTTAFGHARSAMLAAQAVLSSRPARAATARVTVCDKENILISCGTACHLTEEPRHISCTGRPAHANGPSRR